MAAARDPSPRDASPQDPSPQDPSPRDPSPRAPLAQGSPESPLRVLAHPLRSRLLAELRVHGEATATQLAVALDTNTGATSYHLRRLADVGLIEDTGTGVGKRRVWQAAPDAQRRADHLDDDPVDEDDRSALDWLAMDYLAHFSDRAGRWLQQRREWPEAWQVAGLEDHLVLVSAEQLTALRAELVEVLQRYRRVGQGNPQAKRVVVYTCALPLDPLPSQSPARPASLTARGQPASLTGRGQPAALTAPPHRR